MNKLAALWLRIEKIFYDDILLILGITFFNIFPIKFEDFINNTNSSYLIKLIKSCYRFSDDFLIVFFIFFLLSFCNKILKKIIVSIVFILSGLLFAGEMLSLKLFGSIISPRILQVILETNKNEAFEFIDTYFKFKYLFYIFVILGFFLLIKKWLKKFFNFTIKNIFKLKILRLLFIFVLFAKILFISKTPLVNFTFGRIHSSMKICNQVFKQYKEIEKIKADITFLEKNSNIKNVIFIIGESTTRNHMGMYGYSLDTTPLMEKLEKDGNLFKFKDVISPHAHTIPSLKKILTFYNQESTKKWFEYNNLIDIMKLADYKTYWFSNQESSGLYGNVATAFAKKSDILLFNNKRDSSDRDVKNSYDEQIIDKSIPYIDNNSNNFIIYHLIGTHSTYKNRYPKEFNKFKNKNDIISSYDNAILYNDFIINKIISLFKDTEAIIFYLSDHGEEVYDFREFVGHAEGNGSRYMIEIPFIIYTTNKFKENHSNIINKIKNSLNNPYMTDDFIHTLLDITQIKTVEFDETRSIISDKFNSDRKRIFAGKNYDEYWKNKN